MQNKKIYLNQERKYRDDIYLNDSEQKIHLIIEESDLLISCTNKINPQEIYEYLYARLLEYREQIQEYSVKCPEFATSLVALKNAPSSPYSFIKEMNVASKLVNVGSFAGIAGTIAEYIAKDTEEFLKKQNLPSDVIVENGGDIFLISSTSRNIALLDNPRKKYSLGLKIPAGSNLSICSSSSTIGHSLSFGNAELCTIIASKGSVADVCATALCNMLKSKDDFPKITEKVQALEKYGVQGIFASCDENICAYGNIIELWKNNF